MEEELESSILGLKLILKKNSDSVNVMLKSMLFESLINHITSLSHFENDLVILLYTSPKLEYHNYVCIFKKCISFDFFNYNLMV